MGVEHTHDLGITHLYPATTSTVDHRLEVRQGMVWQWGEEESLFRDSYSSLFWEKCPTEMTYHPKNGKTELESLSACHKS